MGTRVRWFPGLALPTINRTLELSGKVVNVSLTLKLNIKKF